MQGRFLTYQYIFMLLLYKNIGWMVWINLTIIIYLFVSEGVNILYFHDHNCKRNSFIFRINENISILFWKESYIDRSIESQEFRAVHLKESCGKAFCITIDWQKNREIPTVLKCGHHWLYSLKDSKNKRDNANVSDLRGIESVSCIVNKQNTDLILTIAIQTQHKSR